MTFVKGIIGHFIQCDDEQEQKSGIKREREQQTSELVRNTIDPCVCLCVCVINCILAPTLFDKSFSVFSVSAY